MALAGRPCQMDDIDRANYDLAERLNSEFAVVKRRGLQHQASADNGGRIERKGRAQASSTLTLDHAHAGDGSRNYVVFDENLIEIVRKYGVAGALAAGLLTQEQAKQFMQQQGPSQGDWESSAYKAGRGA
jgi:hypothetical protein